MARSGTIKTLAALVAALTVGAGVLLWTETDPARPAVPLPLEALKSAEANGALAVIRDTEIPLQFIKWAHIVVHDAGQDGPKAVEGCHFLIGGGGEYPLGTIVPTRRWRRQFDGSHVSVPGFSYNENSIGICVLADCRESAAAARQFAALTKLVRGLQVTFQIPRDHVYLHADLGQAGCPGEFFPVERFRRGLLRSAR